MVIMLMLLPVVLSACGDLTFPDPTATPSTTPSTTAPEPSAPASNVNINSAEEARLAVYEHLLGMAGTYDARIYLADFYAACDNWTAQRDYFRDGSGTWYVAVDMTSVEDWSLRPYWQQASWYVYRDGRVVPSDDFKANALRIEADLQAISQESGAAAEDGK